MHTLSCSVELCVAMELKGQNYELKGTGRINAPKTGTGTGDGQN